MQFGFPGVLGTRQGIRHRIAGLHLHDGRLLLVRHKKQNREYYLLPGGGQEAGESAVEALIREWKEELNLNIRVGKFLFCGESVPTNARRMQVFQMVFAVEAIEGQIAVRKQGPLAGYAWVPLAELNSITIFPDCLSQINAYCSGREYDIYQRYRWLT
ncbi:MAG: NUDIX domain-containing protein [Turneriella sp.]|nr:NUDIX domain-containing protein [Turneriella sp.]